MIFPTPRDNASGEVAGQARRLAASTRPDPGRLAEVRIPDSAAAAEAERPARTESASGLDGHAVRSYVFAALLAARDGMGYDQELLYVGCVLHDIGLTPRLADPSGPSSTSARTPAPSSSSAQGRALPRRYRLLRTVVLHMARPFPRPRRTRCSCWRPA